jgi:tRNA and rRNA cytosine-C5-methylases
MRLPDKFTEQMKMMLKDEYQDYLDALEQPMYHALRVNTLKISVEDFLKISPFKLTPVPWSSNGFYYDETEASPSKHPYYYAGLYYLQEPSALLPASEIPIEAGDKVLDICAAPGGKSTELLARLGKTGYLVSNDISASRAKALIKNLELFGAENVLVTCESTDKLAGVYDHYFDKILIDAPCSGEGMFRKSSSMVTAWERNGNEYFATIQRSILTEAVKMLRPGGVILYSTCTFSGMEDEDSVMYLLSLNDNLELISVRKFDGFVDGNPDWSSYDGAADAGLDKTAHLFPHRVKGEGHFVSLIKDNSEADAYSSVSDYYPARFKMYLELSEFLTHIDRNFDLNRFEDMNGRIYYIPEGCPENGRLHVLRRGLLMGEVKKNRFEPSQALAMNLVVDEFDNVLKLTADDERVMRYLKGETIEYSEEESVEKGWILIAVDGYPLGFGKADRGQIKNKYLPGWRIQ